MHKHFCPKHFLPNDSGFSLTPTGGMNSKREVYCDKIWLSESSFIFNKMQKGVQDKGNGNMVFETHSTPGLMNTIDAVIR
jgi:hypothetical protein